MDSDLCQPCLRRHPNLEVSRRLACFSGIHDWRTRSFLRLISIAIIPSPEVRYSNKSFQKTLSRVQIREACDASERLFSVSGKAPSRGLVGNPDRGLGCYAESNGIDQDRLGRLLARRCGGGPHQSPRRRRLHSLDRSAFSKTCTFGD
jgi:hypothetical protein